MKAAAETGNISAIMRLISLSSTLKPADFIKKSVGSLLFIYYTYIDKFHVRPRDMEDLVDGLLYMDAYGYIEEQRSIKNRQDKNNGTQ